MPGFSASHRLRTGRYSEQDQIYLVTANTFGRNPIFEDHHLGRKVAQQFREAQSQDLATSLAWVVMPDHFHWLVQLHIGSLSELMCQVKSLSTRSINASAGRSGRLWQSGFHDRALRKEEDLVDMARYVVANPLRAGLVRKLADYPLWDAVWAPR